MTDRADLFFAPLRSLRLCVRLYWHCVSTGHDREMATTGGRPSPMLRMVPLLLRNAFGSPVPGRNYFAFNYRDRCVIPKIALNYGGSGQHLLLVFASLCESILALGFDRA